MRAFWLPSGMTAGARKLHTTMHNLAADKLVQESAGSTTDRLIREAPIPGGNRDQGSTLDPETPPLKSGASPISTVAPPRLASRRMRSAQDTGFERRPTRPQFSGAEEPQGQAGQRSLAVRPRNITRAQNGRRDQENRPDQRPDRNRHRRCQAGSQPVRARGGTKQIQNYLNGIADVVTTTNGYLSQTQPGDSWSCNPVHMPQSGLTVVKGWDRMEPGRRPRRSSSSGTRANRFPSRVGRPRAMTFLMYPAAGSWLRIGRTRASGAISCSLIRPGSTRPWPTRGLIRNSLRLPKHCAKKFSTASRTRARPHRREAVASQGCRIGSQGDARHPEETEKIGSPDTQGQF